MKKLKNTVLGLGFGLLLGACGNTVSTSNVELGTLQQAFTEQANEFREEVGGPFEDFIFDWSAYEEEHGETYEEIFQDANFILRDLDGEVLVEFSYSNIDFVFDRLTDEELDILDLAYREDWDFEFTKDEINNEEIFVLNLDITVNPDILMPELSGLNINDLAISNLELGMTFSQARWVMGAVDGVVISQNTDQVTYSWEGLIGETHLTFEDGILVAMESIRNQ